MLETEDGLTCSSINLRLEPKIDSAVLHALGPQEPVEIVGEVADMLQIRAPRWEPPFVGYVLRSGIIRAGADMSVFPRVDVGPGLSIPAVPISLPLSVFRRWLDSDDESPWLPRGYSGAVQVGMRPSVGQAIRQAIADHRAAWDAWVAEVQTGGRQATATVDEWIAIMEGGRPMWSLRAERIFAEASEHSSCLGWVVPVDVVRWTGHVQVNAAEPKYKTWYEVRFTKLDRELKGWFKSSILDDFILPTPETSISIPGNRDKVFDLARPRLRLPADPEIQAAHKAGRAAAQYIDVKRALGWGVLHHNLCGEFCVAALAAGDVIPTLQAWLAASPAARDILANDHGTSIPDLQSMLDALGLKYEFYQAEGSIAPLTATYLRRNLDAGRMAITFTGVTPGGIIRSHSRIRHWIVIEDVLRVGNSAWMRIYNPFTNREEVYPFEQVIDMPSRSSLGLWVEPRRPEDREPGLAQIGHAVFAGVGSQVNYQPVG